MKERLNLTIDGALLDSMKAYAASKQMSVSELVEDYFRSVTRAGERRNILEMVDQLEKPDLPEELYTPFHNEQGGNKEQGGHNGF